MEILFYAVVVLLLAANLYFVTRENDSDEKEDEYLIKGIVSELIDNEESQINKLLNKLTTATSTTTSFIIYFFNI